MNGDRLTLLEAVCARPNDDTPRFAYADWLDRHGDRHRAEFIRLQCEVTILRLRIEGANSADGRMLKRRQAKMQRRIESLLERNHGRWDDEAANAFSYHALDVEWGYERGFVAWVRGATTDAVQAAAAAEGSLPVDTLVLTSWPESQEVMGLRLPSSVLTVRITAPRFRGAAMPTLRARWHPAHVMAESYAVEAEAGVRITERVLDAFFLQAERDARAELGIKSGDRWVSLDGESGNLVYCDRGPACSLVSGRMFAATVASSAADVELAIWVGRCRGCGTTYHGKLVAKELARRGPSRDQYGPQSSFHIISGIVPSLPDIGALSLVRRLFAVTGR